MKSKINFILDALMFLSMAAITGVGLLIKYVLIPGQERWVTYGRNVDLQMFGLNRHDWGSIHLIIGYILIGLLIVHIILHWKAILCLFRCTIKWSLFRSISAILFLIICSSFIFVPFVFKPEILERGHGNGGNMMNKNHKMEEINNSKHLDTTANISNDINDEKDKKNTAYEVKGYMTLEEISQSYSIPSNYIKTQLKIALNVSNKQRLGQLKKQYNFTMHDIEIIIEKYKSSK